MIKLKIIGLIIILKTWINLINSFSITQNLLYFLFYIIWKKNSFLIFSKTHCKYRNKKIKNWF